MPTREIRVRLRVLDDGSVVLQRFGRNVDRTANAAVQDFGRMRVASQQTLSAFRAIGSATAVLGLGVLARNTLRTVDRMKELRSQLRIVTDGEEDLNRTYGKTLGIANETRSSLDATVNLYARLARATKTLDLSQQELLKVTRVINQAFQVSGATGQEAAAATIQLAQGLAAGALRGDEFRSVNEQAPRIMTALADSIGVTRGELRALAFDGKLTSEILVNALLDQAGVIDSEFKNVEVTVGSAFQVLGNNVGTLVSNIDRTTGTTSELTQALFTLAGAIEAVNKAMDSPIFRNYVEFMERATAGGAGPLLPNLERLTSDIAKLVGLGDTFDEVRRQAREQAIANQEYSSSAKQAADATLEQAAAVDTLEEAGKQLEAQQSRLVSDARTFAATQADILLAQFEARAPGLDTGERARQEKEVNEQIRQIQERRYTQELQIARNAAFKKRTLVDKLVSDEKEAARIKVGIAKDLAQQELEIQSAKRDEIKDQIITALNEEKRLRVLAARAGAAAERALGKSQQDESKNDRAIRLREEAKQLERMKAPLDEQIQAWERLQEVKGSSQFIYLKLLDLQERAKEEADAQAEKAKEGAKGYESQLDEIKKLAKESSIETSVVLDDTAFRDFLQEVAQPSEHTVKINTVEQKRAGGPVLRRAGGGGIPGYGGGDRVPAMLERGEWVFRKEAVRFYGPGVMSALNSLTLPPPIHRQSGGPVDDISPLGAGSRDVVDLNLNFGGQRYALSGDREVVRALTRDLKSRQSGVGLG